jgi:diguanylate cyclase (GGDEF)-like protein
MRLASSSIELCHYAIVPLMLAERVVGVLFVDNPFNNRTVLAAELDDLLALTNLAAIAVERARLYERLRRMAEIDGLTGLVNRRRFEELLPALFEDSRAHREPLTLLVIDLDHFKTVNDTHGHLAGDDLLREVASVILQRVRQGDVAARYGGDEMVVVLPRAGVKEGAAIGELFRQTIEARRFGRERWSTSLSIGVAQQTVRHHTPKELLADADRALYLAKAAGRNRVEIYQSVI